jgi:hypothetical protein
VAALLGAACSSERDYYFVGRVYDGAYGVRLSDYKLTLEYLDQVVHASVHDGRYLVGPLPPLQDYTITIERDRFRPFLSHNAMLPDASPKKDTSFYFDAYLFSSDLQSPAATFYITLSDSDAAPSGTIRLRPVAHSKLYDTPAEMPAGVPTQVWENDEDLQLATVEKPFSNGSVSFAQGELIYGVSYLVTIFAVGDHQLLDGAYVAGVQGDASFIVPPLMQPPLKLAYVSTSLGVPVPTGQVDFVFDQPAVFDPLMTDTAYLRALEAAFSISSPDANNNGILNTLLPPGMRGIHAALDGNKLTLTWGQQAALQPADPGDPIRSVTYVGLDAVMLRPAKAPLAGAVSLGTLLGAPSVTVPVSAP